MEKAIMKKDFAKAFKRTVLLAILLAVVSAIAIPLSLSRQLKDISALRGTAQEAVVQQDGEQTERHHDQENLWKSQITPLSAVNYAVMGGAGMLWLVLLGYYWLLVMAWLYKSAVKEGMNKSLWPILGLFTNLLAVSAFLIVRDNPRREKSLSTK